MAAQVDEGAPTGFSAKAAEYDALSTSHPVVIWMRERIRGLVESHLPAGGSILEINAGSGLDAAYFAARGCRVHATDVAPGMLQAARAKAALPAAGARMTVEERSFADLEGVPGAPYDLVFSNLGGLNCIDDLTGVARGIRAALRPGGAAVLVLMPPLCPWELAQALRGHLRTAFRRLNRGGTLAHVEGEYVRTWYHTPGSVMRALGPDFERVALRSFCVAAPPSFFEGFARRHPAAIRRLIAIDDRLGRLWPFNLAGDFYAIVARRREGGV